MSAAWKETCLLLENNAAQGRGSQLLMYANPNPDPVPRPVLGSAQLCTVPMRHVKCSTRGTGGNSALQSLLPFKGTWVFLSCCKQACAGAS